MGKLHKGSLLALSVLFCLLLCGCQGLGGKSPNQRSVAQVMALDLVPGSEPIRLRRRDGNWERKFFSGISAWCCWERDFAAKELTPFRIL